MIADRSAGRTLGALLVLQLAGLIVPFIMLDVIYAPPDFVHSAALNARRIQSALVLLLANGALATGISLYVYPVLRTASETAARWLMILGAAWLLLQVVDNTRVMEMVTLSRNAVGAAGAVGDALRSMAPVVASGRRFTHYSTLLAIGSWMLVFYGALWRARAVPQWVGGLGVVVALLHIGGVSLPVIAGYSAVRAVAPGLAFSHLAVIGTLFARGFALPRAPSERG